MLYTVTVLEFDLGRSTGGIGLKSIPCTCLWISVGG